MKTLYVLTYTHDSGAFVSVYSTLTAAISRLQQMDLNNTFELYEDVKIEAQLLITTDEAKERLKQSKEWKKRRALMNA